MTNNKELQKLYGSPLCLVCFGQSFVCENCLYKEQGEYNFKRYTDKITTEFAEKIINSCKEVLERALKEEK